ncbi:MAG: PAS domain S-box protein [Cyclobacteriaceae bacterium]
MEKIPDQSRLLEEYRELQLRVTRFSSVEQQLINTRDRLDHELELYKRLHRFNARALSDQSDHTFASLVTEAIIDIFEVESAAFYFEREDAQEQMLAKEGLRVEDRLLPVFILDLKRIGSNGQDLSSIVVREEALLQSVTLRGYTEGLFFSFRDKELGYSAFMVGLISKEHAPLYQALQGRHETIFSVFSQQVQALVANREKGARIRDQVKQITASELELRKLSFIATKTKNGVVITDADGLIEWINESFESTTGYKSAELIGRDVTSFLLQPGESPGAQSELGRAFRNRQSADILLQNISKGGKPYFSQLEVTPVRGEENQLLNFVVLQKDITTETAFRQEILKINTRFELITQRSRIGIWEVSASNGKVTWNQVLREIYGFAPDIPDDQLDKRGMQTMSTADQERINDCLREMRDGKRDRGEFVFHIARASDGARRILDSLIITERDGSGQLLRIIGTTQDVTEAQEAALRLKASEEKYRHIIENMNLGLVELDQEGHMVFANDKLRELTGLEDPADMIRSIESRFTERENELAFGLRSYTRVGEGVFEITFMRPDQQLVTLLESSAIVRNQQQKISGTISIYLDISSVKALQKNLEAAIVERDSFIEKVNTLKLFYEGILNHSPAELFVINPDFTLQYVNQQLSRNEPGIEKLIGTTLTQIGRDHPDAADRWKLIDDMARRSVSTGTLVQFEEQHVRPEGEVRYVLRNILPSYSERHILQHIVVSGVDISDLKRIQAEIVSKNDELGKINAELDNFVYSVSHDLRSPLLSIKGILDLIIERGGLDDTNLQFLQMAESSAVRLDGTIQEILEYSRNARLEVKPESFDIGVMVTEIFDDLRFADPSGIRFDMQLNGSPLVMSDRYRINTLLKNMIGNSVKYRRMDITDPFVQVRVGRTGSRVKIEIEDNGEGISEKSIKRIFEMFYRGNSKTIGTGLGLYICKEILNKLEGEVEVLSVPGEGTTMTVLIPLLDANMAS